MSLLSIVLGFIWHLCSGEAWALWKRHEKQEANDAVQQDFSDSSDDAQRKLHEWKQPTA
jgi:hypothetical protein